MKRYRVPVETWQYYGVYVYANDEKEATEKVEKMINNGTLCYDDEGDSGINVVDFVEEIDEEGRYKI